ncbi:MAG: DUF302 domain-containing protein [Actinomycetota bacterium]
MAAYNFSLAIHDRFAPAVARIRKTLENQGFDIVFEVDMAEVSQKRLGMARRPHVIFGASERVRCEHPVEMLPCHVVVRSTADAEVVIDLMDPSVAIDITTGNPILDLTDELRTRFERLRDALVAVPAPV